MIKVIFLTEHHARETYCGSGVIAPRIRDLDGGEWSDSRLGHFTPRERAPGTHWIGGWVGPSAGLDAVVKKKYRASAEIRTPDHPAHRPAQYHWAITATKIILEYVDFSLVYFVLHV
jgi:hypothetical protein